MTLRDVNVCGCDGMTVGANQRRIVVAELLLLLRMLQMMQMLLLMLMVLMLLLLMLLVLFGRQLLIGARCGRCRGVRAGRGRCGGRCCRRVHGIAVLTGGRLSDQTGRQIWHVSAGRRG